MEKKIKVDLHRGTLDTFKFKSRFDLIFGMCLACFKLKRSIKESKKNIKKWTIDN